MTRDDITPMASDPSKAVVDGELNAVIVEQEKISPALTNYIKHLTETPFTKDLVIDRRNLREELERSWPQPQSFISESLELWSWIETVIKALPTIEVAPKVVLRISAINAPVAPHALPEVGEALVFATLNSTDGMAHRYIVKTPESTPLNEMGIPAGLLVLCQSVTPLFNSASDNRSVNFAPGANLFVERNNDKILRGNEEEGEERSRPLSTPELSHTGQSAPLGKPAAPLQPNLTLTPKPNYELKNPAGEMPLHAGQAALVGGAEEIQKGASSPSVHVHQTLNQNPGVHAPVVPNELQSFPHPQEALPTQAIAEIAELARKTTLAEAEVTGSAQANPFDAPVRPHMSEPATSERPTIAHEMPKPTSVTIHQVGAATTTASTIQHGFEPPQPHTANPATPASERKSETPSVNPEVKPNAAPAPNVQAPQAAPHPEAKPNLVETFVRVEELEAKPKNTAPPQTAPSEKPITAPVKAAEAQPIVSAPSASPKNETLKPAEGVSHVASPTPTPSRLSPEVVATVEHSAEPRVQQQPRPEAAPTTSSSSHETAQKFEAAENAPEPEKAREVSRSEAPQPHESHSPSDYHEAEDVAEEEGAHKPEHAQKNDFSDDHKNSNEARFNHQPLSHGREPSHAPQFNRSHEAHPTLQPGQIKPLDRTSSTPSQQMPLSAAAKVASLHQELLRRMSFASGVKKGFAPGPISKPLRQSPQSKGPLALTLLGRLAQLGKKAAKPTPSPEPSAQIQEAYQAEWKMQKRESDIKEAVHEAQHHLVAEEAAPHPDTLDKLTPEI